MPKPAALKTEAFVKWFRSATPYIHQWGGATFVIAFGGEVLADGEFQQLTHDIRCTALARRSRSRCASTGSSRATSAPGA